MADKRTYRAFTLVELLVVIGIISVLISILLPALNRAREQANLVACESNLRQIGQMLDTYAAEHNGWFTYGIGQIKGGFYDYGDGIWSTPYWTWPDTLSLMTNNATADSPASTRWRQSAAPLRLHRESARFARLQPVRSGRRFGNAVLFPPANRQL